MRLDVTVITGMSGAGRSAAANVFEDLGYFVIDNLPPALITKVADLAASTGSAERFVLVVDVRAGEFIPELTSALAELQSRHETLFLQMRPRGQQQWWRSELQ
jgi:UPF0042 nucleotide-binding protein